MRILHQKIPPFCVDLTLKLYCFFSNDGPKVYESVFWDKFVKKRGSFGLFLKRFIMFKSCTLHSGLEIILILSRSNQDNLKYSKRSFAVQFFTYCQEFSSTNKNCWLSRVFSQKTVFLMRLLNRFCGEGWTASYASWESGLLSLRVIGGLPASQYFCLELLRS